MKSLYRLLAVSLIAFGLSACATGPNVLERAATFATVGIDNPVSHESLAGAEAAVATARSGAIAYLALPVCPYGTTATLSNACSSPAVRREIRFYNRKVQAALKNARTFVRTKPTVNATDVIALVYRAIDDLNAVKSRNAVPN